MDIMDVSKDCMYVLKGWMHFKRPMDKQTGTLVPTRCKSLDPILHGLFLSMLDSWEGDKSYLTG